MGWSKYKATQDHFRCLTYLTFLSWFSPSLIWKSLFAADIDECETNQFNCPVNEDCVNTAGSYVCNCVSGVFDDVGVCQLMTGKLMGNVGERVWCPKQREPAGGVYATSFLMQYKLQPEGLREQT